MEDQPVINCGRCRRPVPQPGDGNLKLYCNDTHKKRASEKRNNKGQYDSDKYNQCLGCGIKKPISLRLRGVMAICRDCHWIAYSMCWRKERMPWKVNRRTTATALFSYKCPICIGWHWTKKEQGGEQIDGDRLAVQERIGDYVRRMDFTERELKDLFPDDWRKRAAV